MKKTAFLSLFILLILGFDAAAQYDKNIAIGFKVGEPIGINIRKYFQYGDKAFDINFGTYGLLYGQHRKYRDGGYHLKDSKGNYTSDGQPSGFMFQGIYSWHRPVGKGDALKVYYGFGGQINFREYAAKDDLIGSSSIPEKQISLGPTGNAGVEYNIPGNDVGVFLDAGVYAELVPDLLFMHPQFSAGVRVNLIRSK